MTCSANVQNNYVFVPFTPHHLMRRTALYFTMQLERKSIARLLGNAECSLKRSLCCNFWCVCFCASHPRSGTPRGRLPAAARKLFKYKIHFTVSVVYFVSCRFGLSIKSDPTLAFSAMRTLRGQLIAKIHRKQSKLENFLLCLCSAILR